MESVEILKNNTSEVVTLEESKEANNKIKEIEDKLDAMGGQEVQRIRKIIEELNISISEFETKKSLMIM